jgi:DNA-directed RNA polymerase specialized sigma24 family protein
VEEILAGRYDKLMNWGELLASGDSGVAREIVHDLCLYLMLTRPNFGEIANLDGYLYTSLRHMYLSRVARLSREALRFVSVSDFDSFAFAVASMEGSRSVDLQNDLRQICSYAVWRKPSLKGFSYFILHFFHGYLPREIAEIACLPVAAIYNKLKVSRTELRAHLAGSDKLRPIRQTAPPTPNLAVNVVSTSVLFLEVRQSILDARTLSCLPEEDLLAHYTNLAGTPLPSALLSHIVSCERCLALIDSHFGRPTLKDRDALDGFDRSLRPKDSTKDRPGHSAVEVMLRSIAWQRDRVFQHRPAALSIAVNGRIIALHDIQGLQSRLAARIERPQSVEFVEVFSDQNVRLAMLPIDSAPPDGAHTVVHRNPLSDGRWLNLELIFDGLGMQTSVTYFDPALSPNAQTESDEVAGENMEFPLPLFVPADVLTSDRVGLAERIHRFLRLFSLPAWSLGAIGVACVTGYVVHRHAQATLDANSILSRSIGAEIAGLHGTAEHRIVSIQETSSNGQVVNGVVDLWKDGDTGRYTRRLFDVRHHLIATTWQEREGGTISSILSGDGAVSIADRELASNDLWKQDLSPRAFQTIAGSKFHSSKTEGGYQLATSTPAESGLHLTSAVLVVDRSFTPVSETLSIQNGVGVREIRLVLTTYERRPLSAVPSGAFSSAIVTGKLSETRDHAAAPDSRALSTGPLLVSLEIATLNELHLLGADVGEPIDIARTSDGRIRVYGSVADVSRRTQIISRLKGVPNSYLLSIQLQSPNSRSVIPLSRPTLILPSDGVYNVRRSEAPADEILIRHFIARGMSESDARAAATRFSQEVFGHAQRAHQHAYALHRLGSSFSITDLHAVEENLQQQWSAMVAGHASSLEHELSALKDQLHQVSSHPDAPTVFRSGDLAIQTLPVFAQAADQLLRETRDCDRIIGIAFSSAGSRNTPEDPDLLLSNAMSSIPLREATEMVDFATQLSGWRDLKNGPSVSTDQHLREPKQ